MASDVNMNENDLPLEEFIKLPTTIDFNVINTDRFKQFVKDKPYLRLGTEFANEMVIVYTNQENIPKLFDDLGNDFDSFFPKDINAALKTENPFSIVPSIDEDGHGTFLASVASSNEKGEYIGAAPKSYIMAVKLRRAREYYINKFLLPKDNPNLFQSTDYLLGIKYILDRSEELNLPVVICISMGSNSSGHDGNTLFEEYISFVSQRAGYAFVAAAGNESNQRHHTQGKIQNTGGTDTFSINVGEQDTSFTLSIYSPAYDKISIAITSPTGEVIARIPFRVGVRYNQKLVFEKTSISIEYFKGANNILYIGFRDTTRGIWDVTIFGDYIISGEYFVWLPIRGQVSPLVELLKPIPEYTIVYPATAPRCITCGAYNSKDNSLYVSSSWGPTRLPRMAPDLVAPGVEVKGIYPYGYGTKTGTSVAAALTAGAAALILEWGIIQGNVPSMVRTFLISGCTRDQNMVYPNIKWGYGRLNLYNSFAVIKESIVNYNLS